MRREAVVSGISSAGRARPTGATEVGGTDTVAVLVGGITGERATVVGTGRNANVAAGVGTGVGAGEGTDAVARAAAGGTAGVGDGVCKDATWVRRSAGSMAGGVPLAVRDMAACIKMAALSREAAVATGGGT